MNDVVSEKTLNDLIAITADFASEPMDFLTLSALRELRTVRQDVLRMKAALEFYSEAWEQRFAFLSAEACGHDPTDALLDDKGDRAKAALGISDE